MQPPPNGQKRVKADWENMSVRLALPRPPEPSALRRTARTASSGAGLGTGWAPLPTSERLAYRSYGTDCSYYYGFGGGMLLGAVLIYYKPDTSCASLHSPHIAPTVPGLLTSTLVLLRVQDRGMGAQGGCCQARRGRRGKRPSACSPWLTLPRSSR